jgi:hypothetical protein
MVFFKQLSYINFLKNKTFRSLKIMHAKNNGEGWELRILNAA